MKITAGGWIMVKDGIPQGMDNASGGYPYPTKYIRDIHIMEEKHARRWADVMNGHGRRNDYTVHKATVTIEWE